MERDQNKKGVTKKIQIHNHDLFELPEFNERIQKTPIKEYRKVEADGNCMYYSVAVSLIELLKSDADFKEEFDRSINECKQIFGKLNIDEFTYSDFLETFNEVVKSNEPVDEFPLYSWYEVVGLLRIITSAEMQINSEMYQPYIPDMDVAKHCKFNVEPFFSEAGYLELGALVNILPVNINVFDITQPGQSISKFGENKYEIWILHTPNHFEPAYCN